MSGMPKPGPRPLRTAVIIDYQNVHLTARDVFAHDQDPIDVLISPLKFAEAVVARRNTVRSGDLRQAELKEVHVYRGQPSNERAAQRYAQTLREKDRWERASDKVTVNYRPLKYYVDETGREYTRPQEKGIDVMCAMSTIERALDPVIDLVILASHDSDLDPALEAACRLTQGAPTFIESCGWSHQRRLRGGNWHTYLDAVDLDASIDYEDNIIVDR